MTAGQRPSPSHAALQRELQDVSGKVQLKRGVAPEEHRKMKMQHAAAMRDVMLASGARKVRMHDSRPTPSPSHAALQRELQDVSGKVQLKRGVAPEEHRKMKMQHAAAMRDVMLASGARKVRMHDSRPTPSPSHAALQRELQDVSGKVQLKRGVAPEEHRKMKMQHAAAMRDVIQVSSMEQKLQSTKFRKYEVRLRTREGRKKAEENISASAQLARELSSALESFESEAQKCLLSNMRRYHHGSCEKIF